MVRAVENDSKGWTIQMKDSISLSLPTKSEYVSIARLTASVVANNMGFDIEAIEDIKVAVGEACNNAVLHSDCSDSFDICFHVDNGAFLIEVKDCGNGFELEQYSAPDLMNPQENGLGIFIMKSLMDDVSVDSSVGTGTTIRMMKKLAV